jgi:hypothetical protein
VQRILKRMSLTSLVRNATPVRDQIAAWFPKPRIRLQAELRVPSVTKDRGLIGTAFDYLLRFSLERAMPFAQRKPWAAESALAKLRQGRSKSVLVGDVFENAADIAARIDLMILDAQIELDRFVAGKPLSLKLIRYALDLAHCDLYYRRGELAERFGETPRKDEVTELERLMEITHPLQAKHTCLLNPDFGRGSERVGGADADLLLDDLLVDVKTSALLDVRVEDWRQLIGYAALNEHFPIGGGRERVPIRRIGVYFARYGYLASWPLRHVVDPIKFSKFALWLADFATKRQANILRRQAKRLRYRAEDLDIECVERRGAAKAEAALRRRAAKRKVDRPAAAVERARRNYLPAAIEWLFVAEAPPAAVDRFFYFDPVTSQDSLFIQTMRVLYADAARAEAEEIRAGKPKLLRAFHAEGCYLIDACNRPMKSNRQSARLACVRAALPSLELKLDQLRIDGQLTARTKIILVSRTVYDACYDSLFASGFNVVNDRLIEFPGSGHQAQFRRKLARLLNANGRPTPARSTIL